jgi:hypothetical protein
MISSLRSRTIREDHQITLPPLSSLTQHAQHQANRDLKVSPSTYTTPAMNLCFIALLQTVFPVGKVANLNSRPGNRISSAMKSSPIDSRDASKMEGPGGGKFPSLVFALEYGERGGLGLELELEEI